MAPVRFAPVRFVPDRLAPAKFRPARFAPERSLNVNCADALIRTPFWRTVADGSSGEPVSPDEATSTRVAFVRLVPCTTSPVRRAPVRLVPASETLVRSAPVMAIHDRLAPGPMSTPPPHTQPIGRIGQPTTPLETRPMSEALDREAPRSVAPWNPAAVRFAPVREVPVRSALVRFAPVRFAPARLRPARLAPERSRQASCAVGPTSMPLTRPTPLGRIGAPTSDEVVSERIVACESSAPVRTSLESSASTRVAPANERPERSRPSMCAQVRSMPGPRSSLSAQRQLGERCGHPTRC